jgi:hypothetical protein
MSEELALGVRWSCGCITLADARPSAMSAADKRKVGDYVAAGAEVVRMPADTLRAQPHFLPSACPHTPKGWGEDAASVRFPSQLRILG